MGGCPKSSVAHPQESSDRNPDKCHGQIHDNQPDPGDFTRAAGPIEPPQGGEGFPLSFPVAAR